MLVCNPYEIIIHGTTSKGKTFRPSDWSERLCGILSSFDKGNRLSYHEWVRPMLVDNVRCVAVDKKLADINPAMFRFLMDFAADNDLRVLDCQDLEQEREEQAQKQVEAKQTIEPVAAEIATTSQRLVDAEAGLVMREISAQETSQAFAALSLLRPTLTDVNRFVEQVNQRQRPQGYRLIGLFEEGKSNAVAVCGFRNSVNLVSGEYIHVDDLVVMPQSRSRGYAERLLREVARIASEQGISVLHVDSSVDSDGMEARHFYFRHGFDITGYHFICKVDNIR